ncbi:Molybdenum cofactor biosynthesis protein MoaC [Dissulfuribacter thermophilus]|uniref:Cyclic pyranopterin monophosphate synthase n=1 Tax=Dissulfuribacter thermophilus TaxID=1156395 RepID=A0A1B9F8X5_9BACT|nr:cyclic pyranopterin monophosphate synthase MoaC [Dissulfuribacter thermophilus]OCC16275.1 Molybdenum cofactor biosynthesis protein MoaC [Dissulfuribacter thermophilus]
MVKVLSHLDDQGKARMVDVSGKVQTSREAIASCVVKMGEDAFSALLDKSVPKGDVFSTARIAGILAAKRVDELVPLCHPLPLNFVGIDFDLIPEERAVKITATARTTAKTGVEMEAMTAATVAALTVYDMLKALEKGIVITNIQLEYKSGGKSGTWKKEA